MTGVYDQELELKKQEHRDRLSSKIPEQLSDQIKDRQYFEHIVKTVQKKVKHDDRLVRMVLYAGFSSYTDDPFNLAILAPTSEGKTYAVTECMKYFPEKDVIMIGRMSPMALAYEKGELVNEEGKSLGPKIAELNQKRIKVKSKEEKDIVRGDIAKLYGNAIRLIDLSNKILVFLEPPQKETWDMLKPILSHDLEKISFKHVNKTQKNGNNTQHVIIKGWPACIFCSAKDESDWYGWAEVKSRFFIYSPDTTIQKYEEANTLISQQGGLPGIIQQQIIIADKDVQLAQKCITLIKNGILKLREKHPTNKIDTWVPYYKLLKENLPSEKGTDMRDIKRIFSLLRTVTAVNQYQRMILMLENMPSVVSEVSDIKEVLKLVVNNKGIPQHKIDFFFKVFMPCYMSKTKPDEKPGFYNETIQEDRIAVTTAQLVHWNETHNAIKRALNADKVKQTYLDELIDTGIIGVQQSILNGREQIYYPLVNYVGLSENERADNVLQNNNILYEKITKNLTKEYVFVQIMILFRYRIVLLKKDIHEYINDEELVLLLDKEDLVEQNIEEKAIQSEQEEKDLVQRKRDYFFYRIKHHQDLIGEEEKQAEMEKEIQQTREDIDELKDRQFEIQDVRRFGGRRPLELGEFLDKYVEPLKIFPDLKKIVCKIPERQSDIKRSSN